MLLGRLVGDVCTNDKIDLARLRICELQDAGPLDTIAIGTSLKLDALSLRVELRQQLSVVEKEIDVVTLTMIDLQHQCRAATETP
jgi:hypothetical protein